MAASLGSSLTTDLGTTPAKGSIRRTIFRSTLVLALIPLLIVGVISMVFGIRGIRDEVEGRLNVIARLKSETLESYLTNREAAIRSLATEPDLVREVGFLKLAPIEKESDEARSRLYERFHNFSIQNPEFKDLLLVDTRSREVLLSASSSPAQEQIVQNELFTKAPAISGMTTAAFYFDEQRQQATLIIASPIHLSTGEVNQVIVGHLNPRNLDVVIKEDVALGDSGAIYLINDFYISDLRNVEGLSPQQPLAVLRLPPFEKPASAAVGPSNLARPEIIIRFYRDYNPPGSFPGLSDPTRVLAWLIPYRIGTYRQLPKLGLTLVIDQTVAEAFEPITAATLSGIVLMGLATLVVALFTRVASRSLAQPIVEIAQTATAIAKGDFKRRVVISRDDEIGSLAQDFNVMTAHIEMLINELEERVEERTKALSEANAQLQQSLHDTHLMLDTSRQVSAAVSLKDVHAALVQGIMNTGAERCALYICNDFDRNNIPGSAEAIFVKDKNPPGNSEEVGRRFPLESYPALADLVQTREPLVIQDVTSDERLSETEREFWSELEIRGAVTNPLVSRNRVIGFISIEYRAPHDFNERELALYRTLCNQATVAIENARQVQRTETALAETQLLYRTGRVLADTADLQKLLQEALVEFLYSLGLNHGSITLLSPDRQYGRPAVYVQDGQVQDIEGLEFSIAENRAFQETLTSGKPFVSPHVSNDPRLTNLHSFKPVETLKSLLEAPLIVQEETIGWIGAYAIKEHKNFSQREIDLARAMADQIAITIQNRRLLEQTRNILERTQALYHISDELATSTDAQATFDTILGEFLHLLNLQQGSLMLYDQRHNLNRVHALYVADRPVESDLTFPLEKDLVFQHLLENPAPLVIDDVHTHPLTRDNPQIRPIEVETMLFIPLMVGGKVAGAMVADSTKKEHTFSESDIEIGRVIADQLSIWLENRQLLQEAQHRSNLLQTAAEISRAASSILDVDQLIGTSVNLIRDKFDFYYVGLFLVAPPFTPPDAGGEREGWAVLRAGTGEAGRLQLERGHRLKIGGESMIGWSVQNRQVRIARDVGLDAVHFQNPYLPETHSEMALPLISRDEVIGALTVQSTERGAFSDEEITVLQTMADQVANAIQNARFFTQTQEALAETETLYQITQELLSARDEDTVYRVAVEAISGSGVDSGAIYAYTDDLTGSGTELTIEQKAHWTITGQPVVADGTRLKTAEMVVEPLVPQFESLLIEDVADDARLTDQAREMLTSSGVNSLLAVPLSTYQKRLGFLLATHRSKEKVFTRQQIRFYDAIARQMVVALENLRLLGASQKRARREEIIREITGKIRSSTNVDDILKTTVTELGKVLGASRGGVRLGAGAGRPDTKLNPTSGLQSNTSKDDSTGQEDNESIGNEGNKTHGQ